MGSVPGSGCLAVSLVNSEADSDSGALMPCLCGSLPQGLGNEMGLASGKKSLEGLVEAVNCVNMSLQALMGGHKTYLFISFAHKLAPMGAAETRRTFKLNCTKKITGVRIRDVAQCLRTVNFTFPTPLVFIPGLKFLSY